MKYLLLILTMALVSCGPSAEEKLAWEKAKAHEIAEMPEIKSKVRIIWENGKCDTLDITHKWPLALHGDMLTDDYNSRSFARNINAFTVLSQE